VKSPSLLLGPEGAFELVLDNIQPPIEQATIKIGMWMRKKGPTPTNHIIAAGKEPWVLGIPRQPDVYDAGPNIEASGDLRCSRASAV
jgi:hypothetical protein